MAIRLKKKEHPAAMFQIAPMIDVVFLLLIYFKVMLKPTRVSRVAIC
jgi:biopolymer transport protein ExbD